MRYHLFLNSFRKMFKIAKVLSRKLAVPWYFSINVYLCQQRKFPILDQISYYLIHCEFCVFIVKAENEFGLHASKLLYCVIHLKKMHFLMTDSRCVWYPNKLEQGRSYWSMKSHSKRHYKTENKNNFSSRCFSNFSQHAQPICSINPKQTMLFGPLRNHGGAESRRSCFWRFLCSPLS